LFLAGQLPLLPAELVDQDMAHAASVPAEASADYGAYLSTTCTGCHQPNLAGGVVPGSALGAALSANLTPAGNLRNWTLEDFKNALRTGITPDARSGGHALAHRRADDRRGTGSAVAVPQESAAGDAARLTRRPGIRPTAGRARLWTYWFG
jgi:hypothetical protein